MATAFGARAQDSYADLAPILAQRCVMCHTGDAAPLGLRLDSFDSLMKGSQRGPVVRPGDAAGSELMRSLKGQSQPRMPFDGPPYLSDDELRLIEDWVAQGARDVDGRRAAVPGGAALRLHGTLDSTSRLDGLELTIGPRTRIDKSPGPGSYVELRGRLDAAGNVGIERLRAR